MLDNSIKEFTEELASQAPTPGGGCAAAVSGSMAAALMSMVCRLTIKSSKYSDYHSVVQKILAQSEEDRNKLLEISSRDVEAYNSVVASFKMPKENDEEKKARQKAIQEAFKYAAQVPLEGAELCSKLLVTINDYQDKINQVALTDWKVARESATAGLLGTIYNVEINLDSIKDEDFVQKVGEKVRALKEKHGITQD